MRRVCRIWGWHGKVCGDSAWECIKGFDMRLDRTGQDRVGYNGIEGNGIR